MTGATSMNDEQEYHDEQPIRHGDTGDEVRGDKIDAPGSQGFVNRPQAPVTQHFNQTVIEWKPPAPLTADQLADA